MKKTLLTAIILTLIFTVTASAAVMSFTDVKETDWFYANVKDTAEKNILDGYQDGTFKPDNTLKFEEFIKMLVVANNETIEVKQGDQWYEGYVNSAIESKYITEQQKSLIGQNISRREMADIIYNVLVEKENIKAPTDKEIEYLASQLSDLTKQDVKTLTINKIGIILGYEDKTFRPDNTLKRSESVAVISRIMNIYLRIPAKMPDMRTLEELEVLAPVDLQHLIDYPTLMGKTTQEENEEYIERYGGWTEEWVKEYVEYMGLMHNRDYVTISNGAEEYKNKILYYINGQAEYQGKYYEGLKSFYLSSAQESLQRYINEGAIPLFIDSEKEYIEWLKQQDYWIENYLDKWVQDTIDNKVKVQAKFYTTKELMIDADLFRVVRGTLRIKYEQHDNPDNIKYELGLVDTENKLKKQKKYIKSYKIEDPNIHSKRYKDINQVNIEVGKWYEIDMDIVVSSQGPMHGMVVKAHNNYEYIYVIDYKEIK